MANVGAGPGRRRGPWRRPGPRAEPRGRRATALAAVREARRIARGLWDEFGEHDLLTFASAIAFQVLFALVPLMLAALALLGFIGLEGIWREDISPEVEERLPGDAFGVVDRAVEQVLTEGRELWLTFGLAFALFQLSGAIRAASGPLNAIYGMEERRPWYRRLVVSVGLAIAIGPALLIAVVSLTVGEELLAPLDLSGPLSLAIRWTVAALLLLLSIWLTLRYAPAGAHELHWVSAGSALVIVGWTAVSLVYGWYATSVAPYDNVFGALASIIVLMTYLYLLAVAFLAGAQLDALLREREREHDH